MDTVLKHNEITDKIIKAFYNVYNILGYGFLEKVYERALLIELRKLGLYCDAQFPIKVFFENNLIGEYFADIVVEGSVIIEIKAAENLCAEHECQLVNYLKATKLEVGLLINFGKAPQFKRKIFDNQYKKIRFDQFNQLDQCS